MTVIRSTPEPAPLDISRLELGPPLEEDALPSAPGRDLVTYGANDAIVARTVPDKPREPRQPAKLPPPGPAPGGPHVRYMTPREMQLYSENLYAAGYISFDDYEVLAFQPDLHPDFGRTIGALTGERAQPDRPRDFIRLWQERLNFAQRYYPSNSREVRRAHRILEAIKAFPNSSSMFN